MKRHPLSLKWTRVMVATSTLLLFSCKIQPDEQVLVRHGDYTYRGSVAHGVYLSLIHISEPTRLL